MLANGRQHHSRKGPAPRGRNNKTARADLYDQATSAIDYNLSSDQTAFDLASTDFAGGDATGGLTALFDGVDDDLLYAPQNIYIGSVDALTNNAVFSGRSCAGRRAC